MERITQRSKTGEAYIPECFSRCDGDGCSEKCNDCEVQSTLIETLAKYEDLAVTPEQLKELDKLYLVKCEEVNQLNAKLAEAEEYNNGWIPCSSGEMPKCGDFDVKKVWVTMHRKGIDFYFTKKVSWNNYLKCWEWKNGKKMADDWEVIAWRYMEVPTPYQPKGE